MVNCFRMPKCEGGIHGIVVVFASLLTWVCAFGTSNSTGLYNLDFEKSFNATSAAVSLVGAINMGIFFGAGPLVGILVCRWSRRKIAVVGALLSTVGLAAMPFSPNIVYMYFFYGILNGVGASMVVISSQVLCGEYFTKHRAFTSSIVLSGTGIGSTTFPIIINKLLHVYGWRGSLLLLCGLNLHMVVFALLLFPVKYQAQQTEDKSVETERSTNEVTTVPEERNNDGQTENKTVESERPTNAVTTVPEERNNDGQTENKTVETERPTNAVTTVPEERNNDGQTENKTVETERPTNGVTTVSEERNSDVEQHIFFVDSADHIASTNTTKKSIKQVHKICWKKMEKITTLCSKKVANHFSKINNTEFMIFLASTFLFNFGYNAVVIFLPQHSVAVGFNESDASLALTLLGAGLFAGCIIGGLFGSRHLRLAVLIVGSLGFGVAVILMNFFIQRVIYMSLSFFVGIFSGFETGYLYAIACDILGKGDIEIGFGYVMFLVGVGCMAGPPLAGSFVDMYKDTACVLYVSAATTVVSGLIMCPYLVQQILRRRQSVTTGQAVYAGSSVVTLVSVISEHM